MKISDLIEKGLIRKETAKNEEIYGSVTLAKRFLERARGNKTMRFYDIAFLLAYTSMFHAARALLFLEGYKERSHFALVAVLKERYKDDRELIEMLDILDSYRISRHAIQYSGEFSSEIDATEAINDAERFVSLTEKIVKKRLQ